MDVGDWSLLVSIPLWVAIVILLRKTHRLLTRDMKTHREAVQLHTWWVRVNTLRALSTRKWSEEGEQLAVQVLEEMEEMELPEHLPPRVSYAKHTLMTALDRWRQGVTKH